MKITIRRKKDVLPGGLADNKDLSQFDPQQVSIGLPIEMEHTKDKAIASEIVADHLTEDPQYYTKLKQAEL